MAEQAPIEVHPLDATFLFAKRIAYHSEGAAFGPSGSNLEFSGDAEASWDVVAAEEGEYAVFLSCSASGSGMACITEANGKRATGNPLPVDGFFEGHPFMNYERIGTFGSLYLRCGHNRIRLFTEGVGPENQLYLSSLELLPVKWMGAIADRHKQAVLQRSRMDWTADARYGVMFHWTSQSQPRQGLAMPYAEAVNAFDVEAFATMVEHTGAGYVIFTLNHAEPHCPAPIRSWESAHPGWTTKRDLLQEIGEALRSRGIRLFLYIASHTMGKLFESDRGQYLEHHRIMLTEIGERYGSLVSGYWFDGWYQAYERFGHFPIEQVYEAAKSGNRERCVAFNFWIFPAALPWQEYWAGEVASPGKIPSQHIFAEGPGKGLPYHALLIMDAPWVHGDPDTEMTDPRFSAEELDRYIRACSEHQGAVTINLGIYQDGSIGGKTLEVMKRLNKLQSV